MSTWAMIKMFRHSEIQRLLSERKIARAKEEARMKTKESSGSSNNNNNGREPRKRRFEDEPSTTHLNVDTLMYDESPDAQAASASVEKKFLWPILGQDSK
ncbi:hypothetical protein CLAIMM_13270 [Cladophialophora immunda]|nr:hypothetical protein CLAIMM_13270 [Cladophialophora immunda]